MSLSLSADEAARVLGVHQSLLGIMVMQGRIAGAIDIGGTYLWVKYAHADDEDLRTAMESLEKSRRKARKPKVGGAEDAGAA